MALPPCVVLLFPLLHSGMLPLELLAVCARPSRPSQRHLARYGNKDYHITVP